MVSAKIKRQLSVIILLAVFSVISVFLHIAIPSQQHHSDEEFHLLLAECIHDDIISRIRGPIHVSRAMAQNSFVLDLLENEEKYSEEFLVQKISAWLASIKATGNYSSCFLVSEKSRRYYTSDGLLKFIDSHADGRDVWYPDFIARKVPFAIDVDYDQSNENKCTVFFDIRVENEKGELLGACGLGVLVNDFQQLFSEYESKYNVRVNLVDKDGLVQVDTHNINIENSYHRVDSSPKDEKYTYTKLIGGYVVTTFINELDWYLVLRNETKFQEHKFRNLAFVLVIFLLFVVLSAIICLEIHVSDKSGFSKPKKNDPIDSLTGLFNRNYFKNVYGERGIFNTTRYKAIAVFDIDFFKEANDNLDGDAILVHVSECARRIFSQDEIFRWGGDEFTVLITQPFPEAYELCRDFVSELEKENQVTVSVGVTEVRLSDTIKKNYYRAAQACYLVKEMGGNGVKRS